MRIIFVRHGQSTENVAMEKGEFDKNNFLI
jgi:hypothetical protein